MVNLLVKFGTFCQPICLPKWPSNTYGLLFSVKFYNNGLHWCLKSYKCCETWGKSLPVWPVGFKWHFVAFWTRGSNFQVQETIMKWPLRTSIYYSLRPRPQRTLFRTFYWYISINSAREDIKLVNLPISLVRKSKAWFTFVAYVGNTSLTAWQRYRLKQPGLHSTEPNMWFATWNTMHHPRFSWKVCANQYRKWYTGTKRPGRYLILEAQGVALNKDRRRIKRERGS